MNIIYPEQINQINKYKSIAFWNQISGVRTPFLLGTQSKDGFENLAIFNSIIHIGANPPLIGLIMRPTTVERHSYQNIQETNYYTLNIVEKSFYKKAHQSSAKYNRETSEFDKVGLRPQYASNHIAPFVEESPLKLAMKFKEAHLIKSNNTQLIIGEVIFVLTDNTLESFDINFESLNAVGVNGLYDYYSLNYLGKLAYAKPE